MTKRKKKWPNLQQKLDRPWCFYCERDFDDLKILISHQKAKHFKCDRCGRRLNTAGGLSVHMNQVHKENLTHVENAKPDRQGLDIEIFGMEGVPQEFIEQHNQEVTAKHFAEEQERARISGNPVRGLYSNDTAATGKRPRVREETDKLEERLMNWRDDKKAGRVPSQADAPTVVQSVDTQMTNVPSFGVTATPPQPAPAFPQTGQGLPPPGAPPFAPGQPFFGGPPAPGATNTPPAPFPYPPPNGAPPMDGGMAGPPGSLPQRPGYGAPPGVFPPGMPMPPNGHSAANDISASLDDLISDVRGNASAAALPADSAPKEKKAKDKNVNLTFSQDTVSPEELMLGMSRFAES